MKSKILITGMSGLSKTVASYLVQKGYLVENVSIRDDMWKSKDFSIYDSVVHIAGVIPKKDIPEDQFYTVNRDTTLSLAKKAKKDGVKQFVFLSSMAVYTILPTLKTNEGIVNRDTPCNPSTDYGKSKYEAEIGLKLLSASDFRIAVIRSPSIYNASNKSYFAQYELIIKKFHLIPKTYCENVRSSIYSGNLCELISLIVESYSEGLFFPDDGELSAVDYCRLISPHSYCSIVAGLIVKLLLSNHPIIKGVYGNVAYSRDMTEAFDGKYRLYHYDEIMRIMNDN